MLGQGHPCAQQPREHTEPAHEVTAAPAAETGSSEDDLFREMLGGTADAGANPTPAPSEPTPAPADDYELFRQMLGDGGT